MEEPNRTVRVVRFGVFEADLHAGELRKNGLKIKLQEQPFQILAMLLERPGEVVTREELFQKLWSADTFVDFDHSLNAAIKKLRQALGDSADNPRFVETLARRGYRFIAPVDGGRLKEAALNVVPISEARAQLSEEEEKTRPRVERWWMNRWVRLAVAVMLCAGAAVWFQLFRPEQKAPLSSPRIIPFTSFPGNEIYPAFSPDGNQLAYAWSGEKGDNIDIYVQLIGAGTPLRLTHHPDADISPAWSPDGHYIAFVRQSETATGVFLVPALGGHERKLADGHVGRVLFEGPYLAWSSDGKSLVIVDKNSPQEPYSLFLVSIDAAERKRLTSPPAESAGDSGPAVSPDGKTVAFFRHRNPCVNDVYLLSLAGGEPKRLTFDNNTITGLVWTTDGQEIIFSSICPDPPDFGTLWRVGISEGKPQRLVGLGEHMRFPSVSRQGNRLAYTQWQADENIWRLDARSSDHKRGELAKLIASTRDDGSPQYSPDGKRIAFQSDRSGRNEIWVCDSEGRNAFQLTSDGTAGPPSWSPDGQRIAFDSLTGGQFDIYEIGLEGGTLRRLTTESSDEARPSWSHDGHWIYFGSKRTGDWQVWKVPSAGGKAVQVTQKGGAVALESADGKFLYYSKGLTSPFPGLWKLPVEGGEEVPVIETLKGKLAGYWGVSNKGIYFVEQGADSENLTSGGPAVLEFMSFATGGIRKIASLEKPPINWNAGLSVSPDGRWILYMSEDQTGSDIMLVENFR